MLILKRHSQQTVKDVVKLFKQCWFRVPYILIERSTLYFSKIVVNLVKVVLR